MKFCFAHVIFLRTGFRNLGWREAKLSQNQVVEISEKDYYCRHDSEENAD